MSSLLSQGRGFVYSDRPHQQWCHMISVLHIQEHSKQILVSLKQKHFTTKKNPLFITVHNLSIFPKVYYFMSSRQDPYYSGTYVSKSLFLTHKKISSNITCSLCVCVSLSFLSLFNNIEIKQYAGLLCALMYCWSYAGSIQVLLVSFHQEMELISIEWFLVPFNLLPWNGYKFLLS